MRIGNVTVDPALALAPMEGVTDRTFRRLIHQIGGCGLVFTEFIPASGLTRDAPIALRMAEFDADEHPIAIQVYGRDPELMADAARYVTDLGADIVDLNMGCPSKKVCQHSGGSALLKEPDHALAIVRAMRGATSLPFTVKMRAGWDPEHRNAPEVAARCADVGVDAITVHWRTRADLYGGERELDTIREVVERVPVPVFANGDIVDAASARDTLAQTGAAGLMIGRGAIRDPWVFRKILADRAGLPPLVVGPDDRERALLGYYESLRPRFKNDHGALGRMKKIAKYFTEGMPHGEVLRKAIHHANTVEEAYVRVRAYFDALRAMDAGRPSSFGDADASPGGGVEEAPRPVA